MPAQNQQGGQGPKNLVINLSLESSKMKAVQRRVDWQNGMARAQHPTASPIAAEDFIAAKIHELLQTMADADAKETRDKLLKAYQRSNDTVQSQINSILGIQ